MPADEPCLRCGGSRLIAAHLEHPLAFCVDHAAHHGTIPLRLKALLCQDCGHVEFWVPDPSQIVSPNQTVRTTAIQEEDF